MSVASGSGSKQPIVAIGLGYATKVIFDIVERSTNYTVVAILDDNAALKGQALNGIRVFGTTGLLPKLKNEVVGAIVCVGANRDTCVRRDLLSRLESEGICLVSLVDMSAVVSPRATCHPGIQVFPGAIVNAGAVLERNCLINTAAVVEHDCIIGPGAFVGPRAALCGLVSVGMGAFVGAGSVVRQGVHIGDEATVGAGSVVLNDVPPGTTVVGVPAVDISGRCR